MTHPPQFSPEIAILVYGMELYDYLTTPLVRMWTSVSNRFSKQTTHKDNKDNKEKRTV